LTLYLANVNLAVLTDHDVDRITPTTFLP